MLYGKPLESCSPHTKSGKRGDHLSSSRDMFHLRLWFNLLIQWSVVLIQIFFTVAWWKVQLGTNQLRLLWAELLYTFRPLWIPASSELWVSPILLRCILQIYHVKEPCFIHVELFVLSFFGICKGASSSGACLYSFFFLYYLFFNLPNALTHGPFSG